MSNPLQKRVTIFYGNVAELMTMGVVVSVIEKQF